VLLALAPNESVSTTSPKPQPIIHTSIPRGRGITVIALRGIKTLLVVVGYWLLIVGY